jgi:uncharacterized sulfatase
MKRHPAHEWAPGAWTLGGQGNSLAVRTGDGVVLVDAGPGGDVTARMIANLRDVTALPLTHIVYSHGHLGYNNGVQDWFDDAARRGHPPPVVVAHERVPPRYRRYRETAGIQAYTNTRQFRTPYPAEPPARWFRLPDVTFRDEHLIAGSERTVRVLHAPSETDDAIALWLPDVRLLYGGPAVIKALPNAGSPFRTLRDPVRWARTLERLAELRPAIVVPEFGRPLTDPDEAMQALTVPARGLRWVRDEVVRRMNVGMPLERILHDLDPPAELFGHPMMKPTYGCLDYLVQEVWRSENGWWNRNATHLHPARRQDAADARARALPDPSGVLARAEALAQRGELQRSLQVVDLLALASPELPCVPQARALKARILDARAAQMTSVVSKHLMLSEAELLRGEPIGATDRAAGRASFEWT